MRTFVPASICATIMARTVAPCLMTPTLKLSRRRLTNKPHSLCTDLFATLPPNNGKTRTIFYLFNSTAFMNTDTHLDLLPMVWLRLKEAGVGTHRIGTHSPVVPKKYNDDR